MALVKFAVVVLATVLTGVTIAFPELLASLAAMFLTHEFVVWLLATALSNALVLLCLLIVHTVHHRKLDKQVQAAKNIIAKRGDVR